MKEINYRDDLIQKGIDYFIKYYNQYLEEFLERDLGEINKEKIFIYYVSDLKKNLYEELLTIQSQ